MRAKDESRPRFYSRRGRLFVNQNERTEAEGLEPPSAFARQFSRLVTYQLAYASLVCGENDTARPAGLPTRRGVRRSAFYRSGRNVILPSHSSSRLYSATRIISSMAWAIGICWLTTKTPGMGNPAARSSTACLIVVTSCVNKTRFSSSPFEHVPVTLADEPRILHAHDVQIGRATQQPA